METVSERPSSPVLKLEATSSFEVHPAFPASESLVVVPASYAEVPYFNGFELEVERYGPFICKNVFPHQAHKALEDDPPFAVRPAQLEVTSSHFIEKFKRLTTPLIRDALLSVVNNVQEECDTLPEKLRRMEILSTTSPSVVQASADSVNIDLASWTQLSSVMALHPRGYASLYTFPAHSPFSYSSVDYVRVEIKLSSSAAGRTASDGPSGPLPPSIIDCSIRIPLLKVLPISLLFNCDGKDEHPSFSDWEEKGMTNIPFEKDSFEKESRYVLDMNLLTSVTHLHLRGKHNGVVYIANKYRCRGPSISYDSIPSESTVVGNRKKRGKSLVKHHRLIFFTFNELNELKEEAVKASAINHKGEKNVGVKNSQLQEPIFELVACGTTAV